MPCTLIREIRVGLMFEFGVFLFDFKDVYACMLAVKDIEKVENSINQLSVKETFSLELGHKCEKTSFLFKM